MILCPECNYLYHSSLPACPECGFLPEKVNGIPAWTPDRAYESRGFKAEYFEPLVALETDSFWFKARNKLIIWALKKYFPALRSYMEIGCGTGFVLSGVAQAFPSAQIYGSEVFCEGLNFAARRVKSAKFIQMDARRIPFVDEFNVIGAFDVLEHIEEDRDVLTNMYRAIKLRGGLIITVPQHPCLWSQIDDYACHIRRYTAKDLYLKVQSAGFEIMRSTSFVSSLLPAMWVSRMIQKRNLKKDLNVTAEFRIPSRLNYLFTKLLGAEISMIRNGLNFPIGGSRLIVARKI